MNKSFELVFYRLNNGWRKVPQVCCSKPGTKVYIFFTVGGLDDKPFSILYCYLGMIGQGRGQYISCTLFKIGHK